MPQSSEILGTLTAIPSFAAGLQSLASGSAYQSGAINLSAGILDDIALHLLIPLATGTPQAGGSIQVFGSPSLDGTNYRGASATVDAVTGTAGVITLGNPTNLLMLDEFFVPTNATGALTFKVIIGAVAAQLNSGGWLPPYLSIIILNNTGLAFAASGITASYATWREQMI